MSVLMLDVDGVLVADRSEAFAHDAALDVAIAEARSMLSVDDWQALATGRADLLEMLTQRLPASSDAQKLLDYWFASETHVDAVVLASVRRLRAGGMRVYLATNQERHRARYLMETLGLLAHVDGIVHSAALGHSKPSPAGNVDAARLAGWRATHWRGDLSLDAAISAAR